MQCDQEGETDAKDDERNEEVAVGEDRAGLEGKSHRFGLGRRGSTCATIKTRCRQCQATIKIEAPVAPILHLQNRNDRRSSTTALLQRADVDHEAILDVLLQHALKSFVDLLDRDHFDVGRDLVLAAVVKHLLRLGHAADHRAGN